MQERCRGSRTAVTDFAMCCVPERNSPARRRPDHHLRHCLATAFEFPRKHIITIDDPATVRTWTMRAIFGLDPGLNRDLVRRDIVGCNDIARKRCGLFATADTELGQHAVHVILHSMDGYTEPIRDVTVRKSRLQHPEDLNLPSSQR